MSLAIFTQVARVETLLPGSGLSRRLQVMCASALVMSPELDHFSAGMVSDWQIQLAGAAPRAGPNLSEGNRDA